MHILIMICLVLVAFLCVGASLSLLGKLETHSKYFVVRILSSILYMIAAILILVWIYGGLL